MVYSDVVSAGLILDKKQLYTMRDVNKVLIDSLFNPKKGKTLNMEESIFIVKCSAVYHGTRWAESLTKELNKIRNPKII